MKSKIRTLGLSNENKRAKRSFHRTKTNKSRNKEIKNMLPNLINEALDKTADEYFGKKFSELNEEQITVVLGHDPKSNIKSFDKILSDVIKGKFGSIVNNNALLNGINIEISAKIKYKGKDYLLFKTTKEVIDEGTDVKVNNKNDEVYQKIPKLK